MAAAAVSCPASRFCPSATACSPTSVSSGSCSGTRAVMRSRSSVSTCTTRRLVRCATCSGAGASVGRMEKQSCNASVVATTMSSRNSCGVARTPASVMMRVACSWIVCLVQADSAAAHRSNARDAICCTDKSIVDTGAATGLWVSWSGS